jgi:hypothetical protein
MCSDDSSMSIAVEQFDESLVNGANANLLKVRSLLDF